MPNTGSDKDRAFPALLDASLKEIVEQAPAQEPGKEPRTGRTWIHLRHEQTAEGLEFLARLLELPTPWASYSDWLRSEYVGKRIRAFASNRIFLVAATRAQIGNLNFSGFEKLEDEAFISAPLGKTSGHRLKRSIESQGSVVSSSLNWALHLAGVKESHTGKGVGLTVLDMGLRTDHPHFQDKRLPPKLTKDFTASGSSSNVYCADPHGTWVAGVAAGPRNLSPADYGIAHESDLYIAKIGCEAVTIQGRSVNGVDGWLASGIKWAAERSRIGVTCLTGVSECTHSVSIEEIAAEARTKHHFLLFAAAHESARRNVCGPSRSDCEPKYLGVVSHPGNCPSVVAVGGLTKGLDIWNQSPRGRCHDDCDKILFIGPAIAVRTTNTSDPKDVSYQDGTSFAAPYVAGVAALHLQKTPGLTAEDLLEKLRLSSCTSFHKRGWEDDRDWGSGYPVAPGIECPVWPPP